MSFPIEKLMKRSFNLSSSRTVNQLLEKVAYFKAMPPDDRLRLAKGKSQCFNCLKVSIHTPLECRVERICGTVGFKDKHSYLLHDAHVSGDKNKAPKTTAPDVEAKSGQARDQKTDNDNQTSEWGNTASCTVGIEQAGIKISLPLVAVEVRNNISGT